MPAARREAAAYLRRVFEMSERRACRVIGADRTSVRYQADVLGPKTGMTELRFMQGRVEIACASVPSGKVAELLGEKNAASIARHIENDADKYLSTVRGELRGRRLLGAAPGQHPAEYFPVGDIIRRQQRGRSLEHLD